MKLFHQTGIALLTCSLGGLALAIWLGRGLTLIESSAQELGPNSLALRDIDHLKSSVGQWFITVDLVFVDGQTYLAQGVAEQASDLKTVLDAVSQTPLAHEAQGLIGSAQTQIDQIATHVTESAMWSPQQRDTQLNEVIDASDTASIELIEGLDDIEDRLIAGSQQAVAEIDARRERFWKTAIVLSGLYLGLVLVVWRWMTVRVVRPVVQLTAAAGQAVEDVQAFDIDERGPKEIRTLTRDVRSFVTKIDAARRRAQEQQAQATEAASRVQAIMDTAPDAIVTIDPSGSVATFNQAALTLFQLDGEGLQGYNAEQLMPGYPEALGGAAGAIGVAAEISAFRGDRASFPADLSISPVQLQGATHYTVVLRDITARKEAESEMKRLNQQLVDTSRQAGMAEVASGVLHNVGNVLTSVNVTTTSLNERIRQLKISGLSRAVEMMDAHASDLGDFITRDDKGKKLPLYLGKLAETLSQEQDTLLEDVGGLAKHIDHIKQVIASQQEFAKAQGQIDSVSINTLMDDAIEVNRLMVEKFGIVIEREADGAAMVCVDRHQAIQILVNLIKNACDAMASAAPGERRLTLAAGPYPDNMIRLSVTDTGSGIAPDHLASVFTHGFTTKSDGHGFGLHSSANTAKQMGGALAAESGGPGCGATFHLDLPMAREKEASCQTP